MPIHAVKVLSSDFALFLTNQLYVRSLLPIRTATKYWLRKRQQFLCLPVYGTEERRFLRGPTDIHVINNEGRLFLCGPCWGIVRESHQQFDVAQSWVDRCYKENGPWVLWRPVVYSALLESHSRASPRLSPISRITQADQYALWRQFSMLLVCSSAPLTDIYRNNCNSCGRTKENCSLNVTWKRQHGSNCDASSSYSEYDGFESRQLHSKS
jgi:hypothetical protein